MLDGNITKQILHKYKAQNLRQQYYFDHRHVGLRNPIPTPHCYTYCSAFWDAMANQEEDYLAYARGVVGLSKTRRASI